MRIGLISDIHGDIAALHKAFDRLAAAGVDMLLCAGDLIEHEPDGSEAVVTLMRERGIACVQGNHDKSAEMLLKWVAQRNGDLSILPPHRRLSLESLEYLAALPLMTHIEVGAVRVALAHGTPWSPYVTLFASDSPALFARAVRESAAPVLVVGHTHAPMIARCNGALVVNPGAVWQNHPAGRRYGRRTCGVFDLDTQSLSLIDIDSGTITEPPVIGINTAP